MPWTAEDYRAGKMNLDPGAQMSEQDAVNFMNRYHGGDAPTSTGTPQKVQGDPLTAAGGGAPEAGPAGAAMAGLRDAASSSMPGGGMGAEDIAPQGASNPNLGQRIYPQAMKQLAMLPRIY